MSTSNKLRKIHRWLGLIFSLVVLSSAGSGLLHILMTYSQKAPPPAGPEGPGIITTQIALSPAQMVQYLPEPQARITAINLRLIGNEPWYLVYTSDTKKPHYIHARTGRSDQTMDEQFAAQIAAAHLGTEQIKKTAYLTSFNREYISIFRILPVYRFDREDGKGTRVYVSTMTESVTRQTDNRKQFEANIFSNFHKLAFIPYKWLRDMILGGMITGLLLASLAGVILFFVTAKKK